MLRTQTARILFLVMLLSQLFAACDPKVSPAKPHVEWIIGIDLTPSVKTKEFAAYPQIALESIIARVRSNDRVHVLLIDSDPLDDVKIFTLDGSKTGVEKRAEEIYKYITSVRQPSGYKGGTNLGGFLTYTKRVVNEVREQEASLKEKGRSLQRGSDYCAVLLTDGHPEGKQTTAGGEWPNDVQLWAFGIDLKYEASFSKFSTEKLSIPKANLQVVPFGMWEPRVKNFGLELDRPQNKALLDRITTGKQTTPGI